MKRQHRIWLAAGLGVISGLLTLLIAFGAESERQAIIIAARSVEPGTPLTADVLEVLLVDSDTAARLNGWGAVNEVEGRIAYRPLRVGDVIRRDDPFVSHQPPEGSAMAEEGVRQSALLPEGFRSVTVMVESSGALAGDYVEIYQETRMLLGRQVQVLANEGGRMQLLVASGTEVEQLLAAQKAGTLRAVIAPAPVTARMARP